MKLSTSVTFMFREQPFLQRIQVAADAGFSGVEIQVLEAGGEETAAAAEAAGIAVVLLNASLGDLLEGGPGLSGVPGREQEFIDAMGAAITAANKMQARFVHLGPSKVPANETRERCVTTYKNNIAALFDSGLAQTSNAQLLIEPMNRVEMPNALFCDVDEVAGLIRDFNEDCLGLQFDMYHVAKNGDDVLALYQRNADVIRHIQFADVPGRHEPGTGNMDFKKLFAEIRSHGYDGWFGAEYFPSVATLDTLDWLQDLR